MTSLERVIAVLNHQEPDHVPAYPLCNSISRIYTGIDYAEWTLNEGKVRRIHHQSHGRVGSGRYLLSR